jgi:hypothetical protein
MHYKSWMQSAKYGSYINQYCIYHLYLLFQLDDLASGLDKLRAELMELKGAQAQDKVTILHSFILG